VRPLAILNDGDELEGSFGRVTANSNAALSGARESVWLGEYRGLCA
jgi:hypothetical protein